MPSTWDKQLVQDELREAQTDFHRLLDTATMADLARPTNETRWNNEQLLFHMLFGYMITAALLPLMRLFGRLPRGVGKGYARLLDATTRPFDAINYLAVRGDPHLRAPAHGSQVRPSHRIPAPPPRRGDPGRPRPWHALSGPVGPVLQGLRHPRRHLPLPHPALQLPPPPTHHHQHLLRSRCLTGCDR